VAAAAKMNVPITPDTAQKSKPTMAEVVKTHTPTKRVPRPSYADIASKVTAGKDQANVDAAKSALGFLHQKRLPTNSTTEQRMQLRRIYVNGIPRTSYKELKSRLFALHFMLSKIINISYIAQNCVEFVVAEDYTNSFLSKCKICQLQIIQVDPTKPLDPNFPAEKLDNVKEMFAKRVANIIANTKQEVVKEFFAKYAEELQIPLPETDTTMKQP
jgi:hypothetical protein